MDATNLFSTLYTALTVTEPGRPFPSTRVAPVQSLTEVDRLSISRWTLTQVGEDIQPYFMLLNHFNLAAKKLEDTVPGIIAMKALTITNLDVFHLGSQDHTLEQTLTFEVQVL